MNSSFFHTYIVNTNWEGVDMDQSISTIESKISQLEEELLYVKKTIVDLKKTEQSTVVKGFKIISYFSYSFVLPKNDHNNGMIIGNYILKNVGEVSIENPFICLKIVPAEDATMTAKIGQEIQYERKLNPLSMESWDYINEEAKELVQHRGEYWLKPINTQMIDSGKSLSFANFQLKFNIQSTESIKVKGFVYCDQLKNGLEALNHISIHM